MNLLARSARHRARLARPRSRRLGAEALESRELLTITVELQTTLGNVQVELFDDVAPRTVANFLNYVTSDRFDGSFFHRSVPGFVVQGGGFTFDGNADAVVTDPPVQNEFSRSNLRGTVAMAKVGGNPNSATSQFFFNLGNNASNLDNQNGGFTVFGQVVGNGMQVVDAIAALPRFNVNTQLGGGAFTETPLRNYTTGQTVTAANLVVVQNVVLVGNAAPIVLPFSTTPITVGEGQGLAPPQVVVRDYNPGSALTYSLVNPPAGANINPNTGAISWTPTASQGNQTYQLQVRATNSQGLSDTDTFSVRVNDAPAIAPLDTRTVAEGSLVTFQIQATDTDTPAANLTYSLEPGGPQGATFDPNTRTFNWTPSEAQGPGSYQFLFRVRDNTNLTSTQTVTVNVTEANQAPVLAPIGNKSVARGNELSFVVSATDADLPANTLSFSLDAGAPAGATFDPATRTFRWTPSPNQVGSFSATIRVNDGAGGSDFETVQLQVTRPNQAPTLNPVANQTVAEGATLSLTLTATDPDLPNDRLRFALSPNAPAGATLDEAGNFRFTPSEAQGPGNYLITVGVADELGASTTETFSVSVTEVPSAPVLAAIADRSAPANQSLVIQPSASDADLPAQALTFTLGRSAPANATIDPATGRIVWTPGDDDIGTTANFTVTVTDATGLGASQTFLVTVTDADDPTALLLSPRSFQSPSAGLSGAGVIAGPELERLLLLPLTAVTTPGSTVPGGAILAREEFQGGAPNFTFGPDTGVGQIRHPEAKEDDKNDKQKKSPDGNRSRSTTPARPTSTGAAPVDKTAQEAATPANSTTDEAPRTTAAAGATAETRDPADAIFAAWDGDDAAAPTSLANDASLPSQGAQDSSTANVSSAVGPEAAIAHRAPRTASASDEGNPGSPEQPSTASAPAGTISAAWVAGMVAPLLVTQLAEREKKPAPGWWHGRR